MAIQDNYIKTAFRLPRDLHGELTAVAESKGRSLNAEIIERLQNGSGTNHHASEILAILRSEIQATSHQVQPNIMRLAMSISMLPESKVNALSELLGITLK
jgi:hypothetical protein